MSELVEKLFAIHDALEKASIPHAFGGAIALAYCVEEPRGTRDLDVNIFVDAATARRTLAHLPAGVKVTEGDIATVERDGQTRLYWDDTPVDVFLNNLPLHDAVDHALGLQQGVGVGRSAVGADDGHHAVEHPLRDRIEGADVPAEHRLMILAAPPKHRVYEGDADASADVTGEVHHRRGVVALFRRQTRIRSQIDRHE